jgi:hypothetical protein
MVTKFNGFLIFESHIIALDKIDSICCREESDKFIISYSLQNGSFRSSYNTLEEVNLKFNEIKQAIAGL